MYYIYPGEIIERSPSPPDQYRPHVGGSPTAGPPPSTYRASPSSPPHSSTSSSIRPPRSPQSDNSPGHPPPTRRPPPPRPAPTSAGGCSVVYVKVMMVVLSLSHKKIKKCISRIYYMVILCLFFWQYSQYIQNTKCLDIFLFRALHWINCLDVMLAGVLTVLAIIFKPNRF